MRQILTTAFLFSFPENKNKKATLIFNLLCFALPLLIVGIWMIIAPDKPDHDSIERASVYAVEAIWGYPVGLTILVFDLILLSHLLANYKRKQKIKPAGSGYWLYHLLSTVLIYVLILLSIIKFQTFLAKSGIIPMHYEHQDQSDINLIFIVLIVVLAIPTVIFKFKSKAVK